ncbi:MAG: hypothetical protein EKK37_08695 [Sphingobacteriales bacterium]|nr:MAG: hypothetical protein EKK37_08695 [Sphingobacteriales bacterium]
MKKIVQHTIVPVLLICFALAINFSCRKKNDVIPASLTKLDSIVYLDSTSVKVVYANNKVDYLLRYLLFQSAGNKLVNRINYMYSGDKLVEKERIFLENNHTIWKTYYTYTSDGKFTGMKIYIPADFPGDPDILVSKFNINYSGANIVSSEYLLYAGDTVKPFSRTGYKYTISNGNISEAVPDSLTFFKESYTYHSTAEKNSLLINDFYLKDYQALNIDNAGAELPVLLPLYLNKNHSDIVNISGQSVRFSFQVLNNADGSMATANLYDHSGFTPFIKKKWLVFYK